MPEKKAPPAPKKVRTEKNKKKLQPPPPKKQVQKKKATPPPKAVRKPTEKARKPSNKVVSLSPKKQKKQPKKHVPDKKRTRSKKTENPDQLLAKRLKELKDKVDEKKKEEHLDKIFKELENRVKGNKKSETAEASVPAPSQGEVDLSNPVMKMYCARVYERVWRHWILPEHLFDSTELVSTLVVRIAKDGSIQKTWFEHRSGKELFDQSTLKAIMEAAPMPPLPKALGPGPIEIGIRFKPGEIGFF